MNKELQKKITIDSLQSTLEKLNYKIYNRAYELNLVGVRSKNNYTNTFDDIFCLYYNNYGNIRELGTYACTVDPGKFYLENPINDKGTGRLLAGQYLNSHQLGLHKGQYEALVQVKSMKVFRDNDKDLVYDEIPSTLENGVFGINIHRSNPKQESSYVDKWSAACTVLANPGDFSYIIDCAKIHKEKYGNSFTYTLILEKYLV